MVIESTRQGFYSQVEVERELEVQSAPWGREVHSAVTATLRGLSLVRSWVHCALELTTIMLAKIYLGIILNPEATPLSARSFLSSFLHVSRHEFDKHWRLLP